MNRKKYLVLCQQASLLSVDAGGKSVKIPPELTVLFNGMKFYPISYKMAFKNGKQRDIAILHDLKSNSVVECDLEKVYQDSC